MKYVKEIVIDRENKNGEYWYYVVEHDNEQDIEELNENLKHYYNADEFQIYKDYHGVKSIIRKWDIPRYIVVFRNNSNETPFYTDELYNNYLLKFDIVFGMVFPEDLN